MLPPQKSQIKQAIGTSCFTSMSLKGVAGHHHGMATYTSVSFSLKWPSDYDTMWSSRQIPTFQRNMLPPSSGFGSLKKESKDGSITSHEDVNAAVVWDSAAAQGVPSGGDPSAGVSIGCLPQWSWGPLLIVSIPSLRTIRERLSFVQLLDVGFEVFTALVMKSSIFWDITSCSMLKVNWYFGGTCGLHLHSLWISHSRNQCESRWQAESLHVYTC
jgi:hypothetical protein